MEQKYSRSIGKRSVLMVILFCLILAGISGIISYTNYAQSMDEHYKSLAVNLSKTAAVMMDGDKIEGYLDTMEEDASYQQMLDTLFTFKENNEIAYIYIQTNKDNKCYYIMDADSGDTGGALGEEDDVPQEFIPHMAAMLEVGTEPTITNTPDFGWLCSVYAPIRNTAGRGVAVLGIDISMNDVMAVRHSYLVWLCLTMAVATVMMAIAATYMIRRTIIQPIGRIAKSAEEFVQQDTADTDLKIPELDIHSRDELHMLADAVHTMQTDIRQYIVNLTAITAEKERIGAELGVATQIQASMLPCIFPAFPGRPEFDIHATMQPAKEVGGDFYDFFLVDDDHLALVMADVSGKGVPAALFMVIAKTLLKNCVQSQASPKAVLEKVNEQLCENNEAELFVTVWLGVLEISTGKLTAANAGHEYPAIKRRDGEYELLHDKHGFVLAGMEGSRYKEYEVTLAPGDKLYLYTDGVAEATNGDNQLYGTDRMLAVLNRYKEVPAGVLLRAVKEDIDLFVGAAPQFDDITMLGLTINPKEVSL